MAIALAQNDIDDELARFEAAIARAVGDGLQTWICPVCEKVRCLQGEVCFCCEAEENDYRDERDMKSQLRHGG